ncbi:MAG: DUF3110 domain-containing protein [Phormidesmis sp.]
MIVYVVLFNVGTENEGIHSIRIGDQHQVLMFAEEDDATRFGILLEAQDSPTPTIEGIEREEIEDICKEAGYEAVLVPAGELITPVENMVEETTWNLDEQSNESVIEKRKQEMIAERSAADDEMDRIRQQLEKLL